MKNRVTPVLADAAGHAEAAMYGAAGAVRGQAEMMSGKPLLAVLIAAAVRYVLGRTTR